MAIYYNVNDSKSNKSCDDVMSAFIEQKKEKKGYCIVYRYEIHERDGDNSVWSVTSQDRKNFCFNPTNLDEKGLLLYRTAVEDGRGHDENYFGTCVQEIKSLMQIGWIVCVDAHDVQLARDLNKEFCNQYKETLIQLHAKDNFFSTVLLIGGMFIICALLYSKFGIVKKMV